MVDARELARDYLRESFLQGDVRTLHYADDYYWRWDTRKYVPWDEDRLGDHLLEWLKLNDIALQDARDFAWIKRNVVSTLRLEEGLKFGQRLDGKAHDGRWLVLKNGSLNLAADELVLEPRSPMLFNRVCVLVDYDPHAKCPLWDRLLLDWMSDDRELVGVLQEFVGS